MVKVPNVNKGPKVVQIQAVPIRSDPVVITVPPASDGDGEPVGEHRNEVVVPTNVGIVALREDGSIFFRTQSTGWVEVPAIGEEELEMSDDELAQRLEALGKRLG